MPPRADPTKPLGDAVDKDGNLKDAKDMHWPNDPDDERSSVPPPTTAAPIAKKATRRKSKGHQTAAQKLGGKAKAASTPKKSRAPANKTAPAAPSKKQPHRKAADKIVFDEGSEDEGMQEIDKEIAEAVGESVGIDDDDDEDDDRYAFHQELDKKDQAAPRKKKSDATADLDAIYTPGLGEKKGKPVKGYYCKICIPPENFYTGSTTSLRGHIATNKATHYEVYSKACAALKISEHWRAQGKGKQDSRSNDIAEPEEWSSQGFIDHLIEVIVQDDQPFTMVDKEPYRNLFCFLRPSLDNRDIPHRTKIKEALESKLDEAERKIGEKFKNIPSQISVTFDAWTSDSQDPYLAITAHYIDSPPDNPQDWSLKSQLIGFEQIEGNHSGENIAAIFMKVVDRYGIRDKLGWATSDNASANDKALRYVQRYIEHSKKREWSAKQHRIRCMEHAVHLAAKHFLDVIHPSPRATSKKRKRPVQASAGRPTKQPRTNNIMISADDGDSDVDVDVIIDDPWDIPSSAIEIDVTKEGIDVVEGVDFDPSDLLGKVLAFVTQIRLSPQSRAFLAKVCAEEGDPKLELVQYVRTRWASMHSLVIRVLTLRKGINKFLLLADDSSAVPNLKHRKYTDFKLSSADWDALEILEEVLADTARAHQGFSSETDPTVWRAIPYLDYLQDRWQAKLAHSRFKSVAPALEKGLANLKNGIAHLKNPTVISFALVTLHPAVKTEYAFKRYPDEIYTKGMQTLQKRFDEYYVKPSSMETQELPLSDDARGTSPDFPDFGGEWMRQLTQPRRDVEKVTVNPRAELELYLKEPLQRPAQCSESSAVIKWWGSHASQYPTLSRMARDYLAIQGSSVASERAFSSAGLTDDSRRRSMDPKIMTALQILKSSYKSGTLLASGKKSARS